MFEQLLNSLGAPALLITDPMNIRYFSGFRGGEGALYISANRKVLITDSRYTEEAKKESDFTVAEESAVNRRSNIIRVLVMEENIKSLAYEDKSMLCSDFFGLKKDIPEIENWVCAGNKINDCRRQKNEKEIESMMSAAAIADKAFEQMLSILKPGMTEKEGAAELEYRMKRLGAEKTSFDTIFASGINSSMPHAIPSDKKLENGDFLTMDFGCTVDGYCSDMTRTVVIGKADKKQKEIYELVLKANTEALAAVKAGVKGCEIDKIARDIITAAGYGKYFGHGLGHSVGLYIHEDPRFSPTELSVVEENVVETVEPGIYIPGWGGVRIEDMILVTKDGYKLFSHSDKKLIEI